MRLLSKREVQLITTKALEQCAEVEGYRFGQAVYNNLPKEVADAITGTEKDMFHVRCDDLAWTMLLNLAEPL